MAILPTEASYLIREAITQTRSAIDNLERLIGEARDDIENKTSEKETLQRSLKDLERNLRAVQVSDLENPSHPTGRFQPVVLQ